MAARFPRSVLPFPVCSARILHRTPFISIIEPQENTLSGEHSIDVELLSSPSVIVKRTMHLSHRTAQRVEMSLATILR